MYLAGATLSIMIIEGIVFLYLSYYIDASSIQTFQPQLEDPHFYKTSLESLNEEVIAERTRSELANPYASAQMNIDVKPMQVSWYRVS